MQQLQKKCHRSFDPCGKASEFTHPPGKVKLATAV
jgi:hypothetical protein